MNKKKLFAKFFLLEVLCVTLFFTTSCVSYPVGKSNGAVVISPNDYTIVGRVTYEGTWRQVCGIAWGGASYQKLCEKAKSELGADDVINISVDIVDKVFIGVYNQYKYVITGIAVKYKK